MKPPSKCLEKAVNHTVWRIGVESCSSSVGAEAQWGFGEGNE